MDLIQHLWNNLTAGSGSGSGMVPVGFGYSVMKDLG